jgi:hypothetical protein
MTNKRRSYMEEKVIMAGMGWLVDVGGNEK